jgi:hypothetical protein
VIGRFDAGTPQDDGAGWKVGAWHDRDEFVDSDAGIVDSGDAGVDHLA